MNLPRKSLRRGDVVEVEVTDIDEKGRGVAKIGRHTVRVYYTVPGDRARVRITRKKRRDLIAELIELISLSDRRVEPRCKHFGNCGGCKLQNYEYSYQLSLKRSLVKRAYSSRGLEVEVEKTVPSKEMWYYRNRMDYVIGKGPKIGLKPPESWREIVDLEECFLLSKDCGEILRAFKEFVKSKSLEAYDNETRSGFLRYLVIREGKFTSERLFNLVTYEGGLGGSLREDLVGLLREFGATSIYWSINPRLADLSYGEKLNLLYGKVYLKEKIGNNVFNVHPNSFFQTNSYQTRTLVELSKKLPDLRTSDTLLDLYGGVGLFSIALHEYVDEVISIESDPISIECANMNSRENGADNVRSVLGTVEDILPFVEKADVAIVDPPRAGMSKNALQALLELRPREIIYFSCNPVTQARDVRVLTRKYSVDGAVIPVDMFPHTPHVESVVKLVRR